MNRYPTTRSSSRRSTTFQFAFACFVSAILLPILCPGQPAGTGAIAGRVFNPAKGEYIRNAQVSIVGGQSVVTEDGGYYRISGLAPGDYSVEVTFTGYRTATAVVRVVSVETATSDFELSSSLQSIGMDGTVKLDTFIVSSEREGNAKAIMNQRNSMNITNSVASDVFGDVAEGNIGEFLKHLPGVDFDLDDGTVRYVRLRGLGSEYTSVTMDGVSLSSADANAGAAGNARAFSFEQVSLSSMESIEVSKTVSADVEANAPAGTINLKTKRAFDRRGRRVMLQANVTALSERFNFDESYGPDDNRRRKILPGGIFEYSDVFLNKRLGVILNISESNVYSERTPTTMSYNYAATAADPRPVVLTSVSLNANARTLERRSATLTTDFKLTPSLALGMTVIYNTSDLWLVSPRVTFNAGARNSVLGVDPLVSFTTSSPTTNVTAARLGVAKLGKGLTYLPKFEYKKGDFTVEGKFAFSESESEYDPLGRRGAIFTSGNLAVSGITFGAKRSALHTADWTITQVGGSDWNNGANFTTPAVQVQDGRFAKTQNYSGDIAATLKTNRILPIVWKAGVKVKREVRDFRVEGQSFLYNYVGPGSGVGAWRDYRSPVDLNFGAQNVTIASSSGGSVFLPNIFTIAKLYRDRPDYFSHTLTATNYYDAFIANKKHYVEDLRSAFFMGTAKIGKATVRAGLRWEDTETDSLEFDALPSSAVVAAGFPEAGGRATTIPGLEYQYFSRPRVHRTGGYDYFFPSTSVKYNFRKNVDLHVGYSKTIRRPTFRDVAGVWTIDDDEFIVRAPNPALKPEMSDNLSARLAYYFEPVGILGINFFQNTVKGLFRSNQLTAQEFGYTGELDLSNYTFFTTSSSAEKVEVRGMELEYSQSLSFLPKPFKGLNVRASYTRNYAQILRPDMAPHLFTGGLSYSFGRANLSSNLNWADDTPLNSTGTAFLRHRVSVDAGGGYRINERISVFFSVRNIFNDPYIRMQRMGTNPAVATYYQVFGTGWTFGVKGTF